jgi:hypothetical protein
MSATVVAINAKNNEDNRSTKAMVRISLQTKVINFRSKMAIDTTIMSNIAKTISR